MSAIFFLIIIGIIVAGGFLAAFIWAVRSGQYEDDYSPSVRILFDNKDSAGDGELRDGETEGRRDGGTEGRRDGETERRRDGETEIDIVGRDADLSRLNYWPRERGKTLWD